MAAKKVGIMELKQLLLLKEQGKSNRSCERILGIHRNTINHYVRIFRVSGLSYQELRLLDEKSLQEMFPAKETIDTQRYKTLSGYFSYFEEELKKPGCTRESLWREYLLKHSGGYGYSQFNEHINRWQKKVRGSGKLIHKFGDKVYVDYTGKKLQITDKQTGEVKEVEAFVAILPASQYTYVEASPSQKKGDFIKSVNNCLSYFGGVPNTIVTDNLKSAVTKASKYEAVLNKNLRELAIHYETSINPTRAYSPQDKALVEGAVKLVYQRIFYPLSKMTFFSIEALNKAIREKLAEYNNYRMKQTETSRSVLFMDNEKPYLGKLPSQPYEIKEYRKAKVQKMGFVYLHEGKNYYSVPYRYIGHSVEVQYDSDTVEIYYQAQRIATHKRSYKKGAYIRKDEHLSSSHKFYQDWSPDFFLDWAKKLGPNVEAYIDKLLKQDTYPEVAYKQCLGIIHLKSEYPVQRIDKACEMALGHSRYGYRIIQNILINKTDKEIPQTTHTPHIVKHTNIRGAKGYC